MELELSSEQVKVVSGIFANLGHIFFASGVLPFLFPGIAPKSSLTAFIALIIALFCWWLSVSLVKNIKL